jgi:hypothetical protein
VRNQTENSGRKNGARARSAAPLCAEKKRLFALDLNYFLAAVKTIRADMVTQMHFPRSGFDSQRRSAKEVVRTVHTTLGRGLFILLNGHE